MRKKQVRNFVRLYIPIYYGEAGFNRYFEDKWNEYQNKSKMNWEKIKQILIDYKELFYFLLMITTLTSVFLFGLYLGKSA